jgi:dihydrofolate reductase
VEIEMRKLKVSTLVTLDGVIQDPGAFGETDQGGWASPYFTEQAGQEANAQLMASDYFLCGRITYELLSKKWGNIYTGPYMSRMNSIPKLVASRTLKEPLTWNAKLIKGDVVEEIEKLKLEPGKGCFSGSRAAHPRDPLCDRSWSRCSHRRDLDA